MITKKRIDRKEKPLYYLMITSLILYVLQRIFIPVIILNGPLRLILISALILIVVSIFFTRNRFLFMGQSSNDTMKTRALVIGFNSFKYFVAFGIVYYFSLSLVFNMYVKYIGSSGSPELYSIPITQVNKGTSRSAPSIGFYFKERYNTLSGNQFHELLKDTKDRFKPDRELFIECRQSVFNSYIVDDCTIQ